MVRPAGLLRAGFPYLKTLGMRRVIGFPVDVAMGDDEILYILGRSGDIVRLTLEDEKLEPIAGSGSDEGSYLSNFRE